MADTTVEIFRGTVQYGDLTAGAKTLVTTDANTRYVIKDVQIGSSSYLLAPQLRVNGFNVGILDRNLTGSEIVDVNSEVTINISTDDLFFNALCLDASAGYCYPNFNNLELINGGLGLPQNSMGPSTTINTALSNSSVVRAAWLVNGHFYYYAFDGDSGTSLYKRSGGVNGAQTVINSSYYSPVCFDGVSKFYWVNNSGQLFCHDAATGINTLISSAFGAGSTSPSLVYCNGFLFWVCTPTNGLMLWYHIASGTAGTVNVSASSFSTGWAVFYDAETYQYRIVFGPPNSFSNSVRWIDLQSNSANNFIRYLTNGSTTASNAYRFSNQSSLGTRFALLFGSSSDASKIYLVDKTMKLIASKSIFGADFSANPAMQYTIASPTMAKKNAAGPSISLRITGVKQI